MPQEQRTVVVSLSHVRCRGQAVRGELRCSWYARDILTGNLSRVGEFSSEVSRWPGGLAGDGFAALGFGCGFGD